MYPTNADNPIASVPQIVMRTMAFFTLEPPVFADIVPKTTRKIIVKTYSQYSMTFTGAKSTTKSGKTPPAVNEAPEAMAACMGFA